MAPPGDEAPHLATSQGGHEGEAISPLLARRHRVARLGDEGWNGIVHFPLLELVQQGLVGDLELGGRLSAVPSRLCQHPTEQPALRLLRRPRPAPAQGPAPRGPPAGSGPLPPTRGGAFRPPAASPPAGRPPRLA